MQLTPNKKLIVVGIASLIIGICLTSIAYTVKGFGYRKDLRNISRGGGAMMFNKQNGQGGQTGMHRMPDGTMMGNMAGTSSNTNMAGVMQGMIANMQGKKGKDLEKAFLVNMIPHHQGAVEMAKLLIQDPTISPELRTFAQGIITAQEREIEKMNVWVKGY